MDSVNKALISLLPELMSSSVNDAFMQALDPPTVLASKSTGKCSRDRFQSAVASVSASELRRHYRMGKGTPLFSLCFSCVYVYFW